MRTTKFRFMWLLAAAALAFTACDKDDDNDKPQILVEDGLYIVGEATAWADYDLKGQMVGGINEVDKQPRSTMFEKYVALEAGKTFKIVEIAGKQAIEYGPDNIADVVTNGENEQPNVTAKVGSYKTGGSYTVNESGLYHVVIDKELQKFEISQEFRDWAIKNLNQLNNKETEDREIVRTNFKETYEDCVKKLDNLLKLKISPQNIKGEVISEEEYIKQRKELLEQKEDLLSKITDTNQRMNNWYELTERTFDFACYARYWFNHGDLKTKTSILAALGSNITLKDKNLSIVGAKPFFLVEKCLSTIKAEIPEFEPTKSIDFTSNSYVLNFINSHLLRGRDSNPDYILQRDACYRYTTPQWVNFTKIRLCFLTIQIFPNTKLIYFRSFGASERQEAQGPWGKYLSFKFLLLLHQFWENHGGFHSKNERRGWRKNYRNRNFPICRKAGFRSAGLSPKFFFLLRQNLFSIFFDLLHKDRGFSENR